VIEVMIKKISKVKLHEIKGEDVEQVVSMVCSALDALNGTSDGARRHEPENFPKTVLQLLQTSSQPEFSEAFTEEQYMVQCEADQTGQCPVWPPIEASSL
jgi:hypothetical protein